MLLKNLSLIFHEGCFWRRVLQDYRLGTRGATGFGGDNWSLALCCHSRLRIARTNGLNDFSSNTILHRITLPHPMGPAKLALSEIAPASAQPRASEPAQKVISTGAALVKQDPQERSASQD